MSESNKSNISFDATEIILFLWVLLCAGTPDLYDAIMYCLTSGKVPLP